MLATLIVTIVHDVKPNRVRIPRIRKRPFAILTPSRKAPIISTMPKMLKKGSIDAKRNCDTGKEPEKKIKQH